MILTKIVMTNKGLKSTNKVINNKGL